MIKFPELPLYKAKATHIYWEPVAGSGEKITAAIALVDQFNNSKVVSTLSNPVLKSLYQEQGDNVTSMISWIAKSLESFLAKNSDIAEWQPPLSGFMAAPIRDYVGANAEDIIIQVANLHSSLYRVRAEEEVTKEKTSSTHQVIKSVREAAETLIGVKASRIFTKGGIIQVTEDSRTYELEIPIQTTEKVGSIISADYLNAGTIQNQFLRAQSDLAVASQKNRYSAGLFISRPQRDRPSAKLNEVDNLIDELHWRVGKLGYHLEVGDTSEYLASKIIEWAA